MDDVIVRSQLWQWIRNGTEPADGRPVTADLVAGIAAEYERLRATAGDQLIAAEVGDR